ncbi:MAG: hypothetical protein V2J89_10900 [Halieaceae bacterium]|jgi:hypothetical protein|nr:hypothetical protein [Halieaceae bacterium]
MEIAALVFSLLVGLFHFTGGADVDPASEPEMLAAAPEAPASYDTPSVSRAPAEGERAVVARKAVRQGGKANGKNAQRTPAVSAAGGSGLAAAGSTADLMQRVANSAAAHPDTVSRLVAEALRQLEGRDTTLGDVATLAAAATRAAPEQAPAIAGALARGLVGSRDTALAAAVATVVSLVPEQARDVGLVVGAVVGDRPDTLAMVAQTVAIAAGEETFTSLAESSGVAVATLMKRGTQLGVRVPFDVPAYAADQAPEPSMLADGVMPGAIPRGEL